MGAAIGTPAPAPRLPIDERLAAAGLPALPRTAWVEVDLDALAWNMDVLRGLAGPGVRVEPVVKADAYGHGALQCALALEAAGADGLGVATWDEALELRLGGVRAPILALFPVPAAWAREAARRRVAVAAGDDTLLDRLIAEMGRAPVRPALRVHLQVETGLGRDGFMEDRLVEAARRIAAAPGLRLAGLWTHLQEPEDRAGTNAQLARFEAGGARLRAAGLPLPTRHAVASGWFLGEPIVAFDAVRPGLLTYGLDVDEPPSAALAAEGGGTTTGRRQPPVRPALSLHARPVRVLEVPAGWGISYGPSFVTTRPSRIATIPLGYADGWPRCLSNRAEALVRGRRVPIVGNVAMDALMVDVTDVPGPPVTIDDELVLIGAQGGERIGTGELARTRTTTSREVVTDLSRRLPRVYHRQSGVVGVRTLVSGDQPRHTRGSATATPSPPSPGR